MKLSKLLNDEITLEKLLFINKLEEKPLNYLIDYYNNSDLSEFVGFLDTLLYSKTIVDVITEPKALKTLRDLHANDKLIDLIYEQATIPDDYNDLYNLLRGEINKTDVSMVLNLTNLPEAAKRIIKIDDGDDIYTVFDLLNVVEFIEDNNIRNFSEFDYVRDIYIYDSI